jgi:putative PIN family toxin of toxin-antitoxin system
MPAPFVVLDTNIVVSAHLSPLGLPYRVYNLVLHQHLRLLVSAPILIEYECVLRRPRFRFPPERIAESLIRIRKMSTMIAPATTLAVSPDETDNRFLECAEAAGADFLVTGNRRHFPNVWKTTRIVSARELVEFVLKG